MKNRSKVVLGMLTIVAYLAVIIVYAGLFYGVFWLLGYQACYEFKLGLGLGSSVILLQLLIKGLDNHIKE